jgi:SAM-dependent methyltransferase
VTITGERVVTRAGGFNMSWQRHSACYALAESFLPPGRVLDLGCGIGHSYDLLAPRETVGLDRDARVLDGQDRETVVADMRRIPFEARSFASVVAVHAIEHVLDPEAVLREVVRVLESGGVAVFVTPNRLTFARPDEIIDPYHYVEFDAAQLEALCAPCFEEVKVFGLFGSALYDELARVERRELDRLLRLDPLRLRRLLPRRLWQLLYDWKLTRARRHTDPRAASIGVEDFMLSEDHVEEAVDLVAVCRCAAS